MDKISVKIIFFFTIVMILCACMEPVGGSAFVKSDNVQGIIDKNKQEDGVKITIAKPDLGKGEPVLFYGGVRWPKGTVNPVPFTAPFDVVEITLQNAASYTGHIWRITNPTIPAGFEIISNASAMTSYQLNDFGDYILTLEVTTPAPASASNSTYIIIRVKL
jgi:hypothetical protein